MNETCEKCVFIVSQLLTINIDQKIDGGFTRFLDEKRCTVLTHDKPIGSNEAFKDIMLCSWCLLESIDFLVEFPNIIGGDYNLSNLEVNAYTHFLEVSLKRMHY